MSGYLSFNKTGNNDFDEILNAIERAGDAYHHTSQWQDKNEGDNDERSELDKINALIDKLSKPQPTSQSADEKNTLTIKHDADMDRYYIPVSPSYEIQTKGKGSSFRIANTVTHERWLIVDKSLHLMLEDLAKTVNAQLFKPQPTSQDVLDAERYRWLASNCDVNAQDDFIQWISTVVATRAYIDEAIDAAMKEGK